mgnify:CR=1 FL=1|tara:strand:- start:539 stop:1669 length:1131 start_codon:yes stop_codon:yes gene_type:complete
MVTNVPVRLVRKDGELIPLDVTELVLDVDRGVNARTGLTGGAKRFAIDLNRPKAVILLKGYIVDDDLSTGVSLGQKASASIDFSRRNNTDLSLVGTGAGGDLTSLAATLTHNDFGSFLIPKLTLKATDGEEYEILFIKSSTAQAHNTASSGKYHVSIHDNSDMNTAVEIATNLVNLINSTATADNVLLSNRFTATLEQSTLSDEANTLVKIEQKVTGANGNTPVSWNSSSLYTPSIKNFKNGVDDSAGFTGKSAGDKVAELYAVLNNSNDGGFIRLGGRQFGDYIGGIQIPFNSTVNAGGEKYKAMNFFMPTGAKRTKKQGEATAAESASSVIEDTNDSTERTFIKGAVTKATFVQMGGEPIYSFDIQFLPIDRIL